MAQINTSRRNHKMADNMAEVNAYLQRHPGTTGTLIALDIDGIDRSTVYQCLHKLERIHKAWSQRCTTGGHMCREYFSVST